MLIGEHYTRKMEMERERQEAIRSEKWLKDFEKRQKERLRIK